MASHQNSAMGGGRVVEAGASCEPCRVGLEVASRSSSRRVVELGAAASEWKSAPDTAERRRDPDPVEHRFQRSHWSLDQKGANEVESM
jgi:hypothetical protein